MELHSKELQNDEIEVPKRRHILLEGRQLIIDELRLGQQQIIDELRLG